MYLVRIDVCKLAYVCYVMLCNAILMLC